MNGQRRTPPSVAATSDGLADLAQVQQRAIELLEKLGRHPSNLRIQVGDITVDIAWAPEPKRQNGQPIEAGADRPERHSENDEVEAKEYLRSPAVGVFYNASEPGAEPFVCVGGLVHIGQQIGIVEAMKLMIPVEADRAGIITDVLTSNGAPVEYDEPLFAVIAMED